MTAAEMSDLESDVSVLDRAVAHAGRPVTVVWAILVAATMVSFWLGEGHGATKAAAVLVIVTGFVKVALIGDHFMELRTAPPQLRWAFMGWCVVVPGVLLGIYLIRS